MRRAPYASQITEMVAERRLAEIERDMERMERDGLHFTFEQYMAHQAKLAADAAPRVKAVRKKFQERWDARIRREAAQEAAAKATPHPTTRSRRARHG